MTARAPFVGREAELSLVLRSLTEQRGVVLLGAAGVGKSRLAAEAGTRLRRAGRGVRDCYATVAARNVPFGALAGLVPADLRGGNPLREAVELVPPGLVLTVDDAHLLDQASIALLQHLARHRDTTLLLTARTMPWDDDELVRVEIGNLTRQESDELVGDRGDRARLWARSRGNPLYLTELIRAGTLSPKLTEVINANLGALDSGQRHALELLAYGEPLDLDVFARLTTDDVVNELETRGLIAVHGANVRLSHPMYGELLRETCPTRRARAHRRALAEALPDDVVRSVIWRLDSDSLVSVDELARAAAQAWEVRDSALTERLCRAAVDRGGAVQVGPVLGSALLYGRAADEADEVLAEIMTSATDAVDLAQLGACRAFNLFFGLGDREGADEVLDAVEHPDLPDELRWRMRIMRLLWDGQCERVDVTRAHLAGYFALPDMPPWATVAGEYVHVLCDLQGGRYASGVDRLEALPPGGFDDGYIRMRALCLLNSGRIADAFAYATEVRAELEEDPRNLYAEVAVISVLSRCAQLRGDAASALELAMSATNFPGHRPIISDLIALCELVRSAALLGRADLAAEALHLAETARRPAWPISGLQVDLARPWALAAAGMIEEAGAAALATSKVAQSYDALGIEAAALHDAARFGVDTSVRLGELAADLGDPLTLAFAAHALGRARSDVAVLDDAVARFDSLGVVLHAAEALAERVRLCGNGAAEHRLITLLDGFSGVELCTLRRRPARRLTPRQLEVARLAYAGMTSREIAGQLNTSKRTVENHLYAVYTALGINGRAELGAALAT
ncbi:transcriptional regulator [Lentzea sp. NBRC 105346]|uniref:LuxR C-terminal-related transcriptional regulator n=1 Tax=Lentzea sp. NBRC 105346 TaxID=3032205 RepID=UPI0024A45BB8|nr:LuxR C-terminal-related transcriptional regulator [Lentzea sp. NBRC 105346]GLZ34085.1 transcriptional regulator [Lentzea sp. NBRC 105346]